ncbi:DUF6233 domain-containing protein [Streptomyces sp. Da 82-17]|uniref:DUF6233 domain-containing protein n=1 Tax=Streptomyces sp. Da 82-17 TaxID=3377116 RepID=UPI0038D4D004
MPESPPSMPLVLLLLPDGQEVRARLYARQETTQGWRYQVGVPLYRNIDEQGNVEPADYLVWVTPGVHAQPIDGQNYTEVPTIPLQQEAPAEPHMPWAWVVERQKTDRGVMLVVHLYDCPKAPTGGEELNLDQALNALERDGSRACTECDAAAVLLRFFGDRPDTDFGA